MSTHSFTTTVRKRKGLFTLCILCGVLLALQLVLPSVAFASSANRTADPSRELAQSEVAVVRLVSMFIPNSVARIGSPLVIPVQCSGLGILVKSWPSRSNSDLNNWVLTDGALVNASAPICAAGSGSTGKSSGQYSFSKVDVFANTAYTGASSTPLQLGSLDNLSLNTSFACQATPCSTGAIVFAFHSPQALIQPSVHVATTNATPQFGIELKNALAPSTPVPQRIPNETVIQPFLTPVQVIPPDVTTGTNELGMPVLNNAGELVSMKLNATGSFVLKDLTTFLDKVGGTVSDFQIPLPNELQTHWDTGIQDYYTQNYSGAFAEFGQVESLNPKFKAATTFKNLATAHIRSTQGNLPNGNSSSGSGAPTFLGIPLVLIGLVAGLLVLILLLILVSLTFGRARARRRRELAQFKAEQKEAQRIAEVEAQRQQQEQLQQAKTTARLQSPFSDLRCPNCNESVKSTDTYCPNCRYLLSPSDSGLHLRATQPPPVAPQPQANFTQPAAAYIPAISDMPTVEFPPSNGSIDTERTAPYDIQQMQGRNLSLAVGTRSDPGIKRQHKPNEDSLFAMQGARTHNSQAQQFGLFVVADGMGGHASGQDASRLAIQKIIDFILPKIATNGQMDDDAFLNLLLEGVQCANQAVHQRNMDERADMGTTMTAALVVGATAYVANVGDSRTYLYREPVGLTKITHDHSVVASLVDAGIIKPDDIYTHPKRNQIYRSLGEKPHVEVDSFKVPLQAGDKLLLCSDGLWDMVRDPDIQRIIAAPMPDPSKTGKALIQAALDGGGEDNVSVIVVYITETSNQLGMTGVQLLAKPDSVTVPDLPPM